MIYQIDYPLWTVALIISAFDKLMVGISGITPTDARSWNPFLQHRNDSQPTPEQGKVRGCDGPATWEQQLMNRTRHCCSLLHGHCHHSAGECKCATFFESPTFLVRAAYGSNWWWESNFFGMAALLSYGSKMTHVMYSSAAMYFWRPWVKANGSKYRDCSKATVGICDTHCVFCTVQTSDFGLSLCSASNYCKQPRVLPLGVSGDMVIH